MASKDKAANDLDSQRGGSSTRVYGGLFRPSPDPSASYLIETDPAFTRYRQWLASDYLLRQLAIDPATVQKRLGDGFYEQQRVREQIAQLTGRRFLDGYASDEAQYQALMNNAATVASAQSLRPGIALTKAQVAALTSDIVWLVEQDITLPEGQPQRALVPQVYLVPRTGDLDAHGGLFAGNQLQLDIRDEAINSGTLAGRQLMLQTGQLSNLGGRITGNDVVVAATTDIDNLGGSIDARQSLAVVAGRDLNLRYTTQSGQTSSTSTTDRGIKR